MAIEVTDPELYGVTSRPGTPTWEIAHLYPTQGHWSEAEYLALDTNQLIEFTDGYLEFLPMPSLYHQLIVDYLHRRLKDYVIRRSPESFVAFAPVPIRIRDGKYREPDVVYINRDRIKDLRTPPDGADLVMEVISPGEKARARDLIQKRKEYAAAGIAEYWIIDPNVRTITVLYLGETDGMYALHGEFSAGQSATSHTFPEFTIDVSGCFAVGELPPSDESKSNN